VVVAPTNFAGGLVTRAQFFGLQPELRPSVTPPIQRPRSPVFHADSGDHFEGL